MINTYVISADLGMTGRLHTFLVNNKHLSVHIKPAIMGKDVRRDRSLLHSLCSKDLYDAALITDGALGCAASHKDLWELCLAENQPILILEDDVITHQGILNIIVENSSWISGIDLLFLSLNTDSICHSKSPSGLEEVTSYAPRYPSIHWIRRALADTPIAGVSVQRLYHGFGASCYVITPNGARLLLDYVFPLSLSRTFIPSLSCPVAAIGIDSAMNSFYDLLDAYVVHPYLAYSPNQISSTRAD